ncbi:MAG: hypothetical protein ACE5PV_04800 [Candidatus Poribacteria bacterium]
MTLGSYSPVLPARGGDFIACLPVKDGNELPYYKRSFCLIQYHSAYDEYDRGAVNEVTSVIDQ